MAAVTMDDVDVDAPGRRALAVAGVASLGAGAIHAAAIGLHAEHRAAATAFAILAVLQLAWGGVALVRGDRLVAGAGTLIGAAAVGGWLMAKTSGIGFVDGLGAKESIQWPDLSAALLAAVATVVCLRHLLAPARSLGGRGVAMAMGSILTVMAVTGLISAGGHSHEGGHGHDEAAAGDHEHGDHAAADGTGSAAGHDESDGHDHQTVVPPVTYDPELPIDLGGVEGVTPQQQAAAENLIAITLIRLPQFADYRTAEAAGFHSIGDGFTGHEHFINWTYINDGKTLDPDYPESLVYETDGAGGRKLVSAMYMLETGTTLEDVPELGGDLTQWHIHDDLCFSTDSTAPRVAGVTDAAGKCGPGLQSFTPVPMIHVWITKHPCGPFAALEGVGAGQIAEGEERLCDTAHGGH